MSATLSGIRVVAFDLDDTLYPERSFAFSGFDAVARWLVGRMACPVDPAARMRELFDTHDRGHVFDRLLAEFGCEDPGRWVPRMVECYRSHEPAIALYPDAAAALDRWGGRFRLALISDGPQAMQQAKIDALGLARRFDAVVLTDRWGRSFWKPHPRAFQEVQDSFQAVGSQCVYIADNVAKDFVAPTGLGWRTVRVRRSDGVYGDMPQAPGGAAESEVTSLDQIDLSP